MGLRKPQSPIVPVIMKEEKKVLNACDLFKKKKGFLVGGIRPPTVPKGTSRLRLAFNSSHRRVK